MTLHFETAEFDRRVAKARQGLAERGLAAILLFAQESHYYLSGYDTTGYVFFQCLVLTADQQPLTLLTRRPDLAMWERSKIPQGEAEAEVRRQLSRRYDLCDDTYVYTTTLLSAEDQQDTVRWT